MTLELKHHVTQRADAGQTSGGSKPAGLLGASSEALVPGVNRNSILFRSRGVELGGLQDLKQVVWFSRLVIARFYLFIFWM